MPRVAYYRPAPDRSREILGRALAAAGESIGQGLMRSALWQYEDAQEKQKQARQDEERNITYTSNATRLMLSVPKDQRPDVYKYVVAPGLPESIRDTFEQKYLPGLLETDFVLSTPAGKDNALPLDRTIWAGWNKDASDKEAKLAELQAEFASTYPNLTVDEALKIGSKGRLLRKKGFLRGEKWEYPEGVYPDAYEKAYQIQRLQEEIHNIRQAMIGLYAHLGGDPNLLRQAYGAPGASARQATAGRPSSSPANPAADSFSNLAGAMGQAAAESGLPRGIPASTAAPAGKPAPAAETVQAPQQRQEEAAALTAALGGREALPGSAAAVASQAQPAPPRDLSQLAAQFGEEMAQRQPVISPAEKHAAEVMAGRWIPNDTKDYAWISRALNDSRIPQKLKNTILNIRKKGKSWREILMLMEVNGLGEYAKIIAEYALKERPSEENIIPQELLSGASSDGTRNFDILPDPSSPW